MGAGASQSFFEKDETAGGAGCAGQHQSAGLARLSKAHGIHEAILVHGLVALEPCVQRRLKRAITKPLDLACLRAFKAEMEGQETSRRTSRRRSTHYRRASKKRSRCSWTRSTSAAATLPRIGVGSGGPLQAL